MAGYNWDAGKSNNTVFAETNGLLPKSKITTAWLAEAGVKESATFIKWLIAKHCIAHDEWHHTSKRFNRTNFYSRESIAAKLAELDTLGLLAPYRTAYTTPELRDADPYTLRSWAIKNR
ncbi:hypothetical protein INS90_10030 [Trueperella pecoris]|uniref:Uncharacterized protein n=1 Tax=Trueperella pecoris TaxID=2733571 RepID=A0A7M1R285_9ACTO|nr:hypothetical protein [Trueperella pecoris]QOR47567.1 hypothetical protein INS90_10030 [Trueperella pecoris]